MAIHFLWNIKKISQKLYAKRNSVSSNLSVHPDAVRAFILKNQRTGKDSS